MTAPCDWDQESYCWRDGCSNPATHDQLIGWAMGTPVYEKVCCAHALEPVEPIRLGGG